MLSGDGILPTFYGCRDVTAGFFNRLRDYFSFFPQNVVHVSSNSNPVHHFFQTVWIYFILIISINEKDRGKNKIFRLKWGFNIRTHSLFFLCWTVTAFGASGGCVDYYIGCSASVYIMSETGRQYQQRELIILHIIYLLQTGENI